ncbi:1-acyl-sn-glycerol-3-phosphate acyltransferase alpha [Lingula anatina]|uniref:1-acyl-sn-glycerol-3-phosphate acyltransferase n=1 Tax=Lingula anatina TaxID=7574 RepID=A0A1S3JG86_LINAN|nr:1-acyl-sn-glycerol-3-phosphate acyltransferase alpha [Lingula anatina]|eukprot:XP_013409373.1 1-acyl-sn-glycerol-3-phosphate acyltransferase alpha [Lingula anatina]
MELDFVQWTVIGVLLILPILYELSSTFKYYAKFTLYVTIVMICSLFTIPIAALRPRDVRNHRYPAWCIKHIIKPLFSIAVEVRGAEHLKSDTSYIIVCNHQSSLDLIGMMEIFPERCATLAKKELLYAGPLGLGLWLIGTIFIDRLNNEKARGTLEKTANLIKDKHLKVWVFPEGTRNAGGSFLPFKKGAFHLAIQGQVPVVPVVMSSYSEFYNKKQKKFGTGKFIITVLPKISTEGLTAENVGDLTEHVRKQMLDVYNETSLESAQAKLSNGVK